MERIKREDFVKLVGYMQENFGLNLEQQLSLVETRLEPMVRARGFSGFSAYLDFVINDKSMDESKALVTRLTTNYTYFMREVQHYQYLSGQVFPRLRSTLQDKDLRIWSAGCSSGEEAYTAAMVIDDCFGAEKNFWDTTILATDISPLVLQQGREGIYGSERLEKLSPQWKAKYFTQMDKGHYRISDNMKKEVVFKTFNLMDTFPYRKKFHVIFCRNVMLYFKPQTCRELVNKFYDSLEPGGLLFVGLSETVDRDSSRFQYVQPSIYRK